MRTFALTVLLLSSVTPALFGEVVKKRVAVFDFDNAGVQGGTNMIFMQSTPPNIGKAAANSLVIKLVKDGMVTVIERAEIEKLLAEQNLTNSDRTDPLTAAKLGRVLGVDAIILGSITQYDHEDKTTGGGGSRFGGFGGISMTTKHDIKAVVRLSTRLVSPDTAEVVAVSEGAGEVIKKGVKVDMRDSGRMMGMGGGAVGDPIMNEAMDKAIAQVGIQLGPIFAKLPARTPVIEGLVADANEAGRLILNVGSNHGVKQGDRLQVWRGGKEIRDPATGKVLMRDDTLLGDAVIASVTPAAAIANFSGTQPVKTGDIVKTPVKQP